MALLLVIPASAVHARSLRSLFDSILEFGGELDNSPQFRDQLEQVIVEFQRNAVRASDFVATASTPGFSFRYDPEAGAFERMQTALGPVYVEPATTVGRNHVDLSFAYLYLDYSDLDGKSLEDALSIQAARGTDFLRVRTQTVTFRSQVYSASATYGITDAWDVNILVPVFLTTLGLNGHGSLSIAAVDTFPNDFLERDTHLGIGDILLRTKYRLPSRSGFDLAAVFAVKVPSGNANDFQGQGDVTLTPTFVAQRAFGPHMIHANVGVEVNASDVALSRVRYALGATIQLFTPLTLLAHVIGSSGFSDEHFTEEDVDGVISRTDIVDAVVAFEVALSPNVVAHVGAIVPLTNDGLRADVVPAGGFGARF
jgi:hypothetical protein